MAGASIYILRCADGSYYTGIIRRCVEERVSEHAHGLLKGCYTQKRLPVELIFSEYYERIEEAVSAERRTKRWSRVKKPLYPRSPSGRQSRNSQDASVFREQALPGPHPSRRRFAPPQDEGTAPGPDCDPSS